MTHSLVPISGPMPASRSAMTPVLIQVPTLFIPSARPAQLASHRRGGRRRIRREVRVAASALMFALPMSWAMMTFAKLGPDPAPITAPIAQSATESTSDRPIAVLSLEPGMSLAIPEGEAPAIRPAGYLVPDDRAEDLSHAGS